eukprot:scaffold3.g6526.t1
MNIFRLAGDMTHLLSIMVLLLKMRATRSCRGISLKTQEMYALVFACRYLDLFYAWISLYNTAMKLTFLATSFAILYYMRRDRVVSQTYDRNQDTFRTPALLLPCLALALAVNHAFTFTEARGRRGGGRGGRGAGGWGGRWGGGARARAQGWVLWTFSIYLEAVAILPQLVLMQRTQNIDNLTGNYVFLLGLYRALYLLNWIYRYLTEPHYRQWIVWISGLLQTTIFADFFYYYILAHKNHTRLKLPA